MTGYMLFVFVAVGVVTYALRASFLVAIAGGTSPRLERYLRYVPCAVLPALTIVAMRSSVAAGGDLIPRLIAGCLGGVVAWKTRSPAWTMLAGMAVLWAILGVRG